MAELRPLPLISRHVAHVAHEAWAALDQTVGADFRRPHYHDDDPDLGASLISTVDALVRTEGHLLPEAAFLHYRAQIEGYGFYPPDPDPDPEDAQLGPDPREHPWAGRAWADLSPTEQSYFQVLVALVVVLGTATL